MASLENLAHPSKAPAEVLSLQRITPVTSRGEYYSHMDGVYVHPDIADIQLEGYELNPVVDDSVKGLGRVCLEGVRQSGKGSDERPKRIHRLYTVELNGYRHALEVTDPAEEDSEFTLASMPGLTEHIAGGIRKKLQNRLSYEFPCARVVSIESNGIGSIGDRFDCYDDETRAGHTFEEMASHRLSLTKALTGEEPVITMGTSMGCPIEVRMAHRNFYGEPVDGPINMVGQIWNVPALVDPRHVVPDVAFKFIPSVGIDLAKELAFKSNPRVLLETIKNGILSSGFSPEDRSVIWHQIYEILRGTPERMISETIEAVPTLEITGSKDPLRQAGMVERLQAEHGDRYRVEVIKGRGHMLPAKPANNVRKIKKHSGFLLEQVADRRPLPEAA